MADDANPTFFTASTAGLSPEEARLIAMDTQIAAKLCSGDIDFALTQAPAAFEMLQQICASKVSDGFVEQFERVSLDLFQSLGVYHVSSAVKADPMAGSRVYKTIIHSQCLEVREAMARDSDFSSEPPDTPFPGIDASPVPAVTLPLPDVAADSPWAKFDANSYIKNIVSLAALAGKFVPEAFKSVAKPFSPGSEAEERAVAAMEGLESGLISLFNAIMAPYHQPVKAIEYIAPYFAVGAGVGALPTESLPMRAWWTLSVAIFPRVYPLVRTILLQFASSKNRRAWQALDLSRQPGTLRAPPERITHNERFDIFFGTPRKPALYILSMLVDARPCVHRMGHDPRLIGALVDGMAMSDKVVRTLYGTSQSGTGKPTAGQLKEELEKSTTPLIYGAGVQNSQWAQFGRTLERAVRNKMAHNIIRDVLDTFPSGGELGTWAASVKTSLQNMLQLEAPSRIALAAEDEEYIKLAGQVLDRCDGCGRSHSNSALRRCSRCKVSRYCSPECQKAAWKTHKIGCTEVPPLGPVMESSIVTVLEEVVRPEN